MIILISNKVDYRTKEITRDWERLHNEKSFHLPRMHSDPNYIWSCILNKASKYMASAAGKLIAAVILCICLSLQVWMVFLPCDLKSLIVIRKAIDYHLFRFVLMWGKEWQLPSSLYIKDNILSQETTFFFHLAIHPWKFSSNVKYLMKTSMWFSSHFYLIWFTSYPCLLSWPYFCYCYHLHL